MQAFLTHRFARSTVPTVLAGLLAAATAQAAVPDCSAATPQQLQAAPAARPLSRADAMVQGATSTATETAAVALGLLGLALLPCARGRSSRPTASP